MVSVQLQLRHHSSIIPFRTDPTHGRLEVVRPFSRAEFIIRLSGGEEDLGDHHVQLRVLRDRDGEAEILASIPRGVNLSNSREGIEVELVGPALESEGLYYGAASVDGGDEQVLTFLVTRG